MQDIYTMGGTLLLMFGIIFFVTYLKRKGINIKKPTEDILEGADTFKMVLDVLPIAKQYKDKATLVTDVARIVIKYVHDYSNDVLSEDAKKTLSFDVLNKVLLEMNVTPSESELKLIKVLIEAGVKKAEEV